MLELAERVASRGHEYASGDKLQPGNPISCSATGPFSGTRQNVKTRLHIDLSPNPMYEFRLQHVKNDCITDNSRYPKIPRLENAVIILSTAQNLLPGLSRQPASQLDFDNVEKLQHWFTFDDAPLSLEGGSWDDVGKRIHGTCMVDTHSLARDLDYDPRSKQLILRAAANASLGFSSDFLDWNELSCRFHLHSGVAEASFADYLISFARTGTLLRRLSISVLDIRANAKHSESRTALALAVAIEEFVASFQVEGHRLHEAKSLIELSMICDARAEQVYMLAELIGCIGDRGRLSRLPPTVDLLERVHLRAEALDSDMLWSIASSCFRPWLEQLNYVAGLIDTLQMRTTQKRLKELRFPELFIEIDEESGTSRIDESRVPRFLSSLTANATLYCFEMLCCLSLKGPEAVKRAGQTILKPIYSPQKQGSLHGHISIRPQDIAEGTNPSESIFSRPNKFVEIPKSIHHELRKTMNILCSRSEELDLQVKQEFVGELREIERVVVGLFFLNDGVLWSQLSDHFSKLLDSKDSIIRILRLVNATASAQYNVCISADIEPGNFHISYQLSHVDFLLGSGFMTNCQKMFNRLITLFNSGQFTELALLGVAIDTIAEKIHNALESLTDGMRSVRAAFNLLLFLDEKRYDSST